MAQLAKLGLSQRPKCVVALSGQYDFAERDLDVYDSARFIVNTENYINSTVPSVNTCVARNFGRGRC